MHAYDVIEAANGKAALDYVEKERPDLVIIDLLMPVMDGIEAIFQMREKYPELRIIAMSGGGRISAEGLLKTPQILNIMGTLKKPFTPQELLDLVAGTLAGQASEP